eukprot:TRINITY_DN4745_c0_g1_i1.p1 TRINITY_DN4745_c0_g1~~TRINITY_DN4745_c0_g1_i1.p1  ORF type:complete len:182 (+),score=48.84 TRINITY_DN4745_c0_g1_i1:74-619(+)
MGEKRMHSVLQRLNTLCTIAISHLGWWTAFLAATSLYFLLSGSMDPSVDLRFNRLNRFNKVGPRGYLGNDEAYISINLNANFSSVFHWNVKQLFIYVTASYKSPTHAASDVVIWDYIIESKARSQLRFQGLNAKYPLADRGRNLRNANVTFRVHWSVMPHAGLLWHQQKGEHSFTFPADYQ